MPSAPEGMHLCPTRIDGTETLFAHLITQATCQQRQREHYHKCPTCERANARLHAGPVVKPATNPSAGLALRDP